MARYIDADALIETLQTDYDREGAKADEMALKGLGDISVKYSHGQFCFLNAIERVKDTPTADVVPKSAIEEWIAEAIHYQNLWCQTEIELYQAKQEVAREIFEEIEKVFTVKYPMCTNPVLVLDSLSYTELKKKYIKESEGND